MYIFNNHQDLHRPRARQLAVTENPLCNEVSLSNGSSVNCFNILLVQIKVLRHKY